MLSTRVETVTEQLLPLSHRFINHKIYDTAAVDKFFEEQKQLINEVFESLKNIAQQSKQKSKLIKPSSHKTAKAEAEVANMEIDNVFAFLLTKIDSLKDDFKRYKVIADLMELEVSKKKSEYESLDTFLLFGSVKLGSKALMEELVNNEENILNGLTLLQKYTAPDPTARHSGNLSQRKKLNRLFNAFLHEIMDTYEKTHATRANAFAAAQGNRLVQQVAAENRLNTSDALPVFNLEEAGDGGDLFSSLRVLPDSR